MAVHQPRRVEVVDSHTAGEPTRLVLSGGPDLGSGPLAERAARMARDHDTFRSAVVNEPRGSDVLVGGLLVPPARRDCIAGVIFFNNVGYLGMCGHGTIGVVATLAHLGRVKPGDHALETPVGVVRATLHDSGEVSVANVPSYRHARDVTVEVPGFGQVQGDIAWGGNWFFLVSDHGQVLDLVNAGHLTAYTSALKQALAQAGLTGADGAEIDHIELFGPPTRAGVNARNFVLCPGGAYDRSPCGTGTSAKLACLAEDGALAERESWVQESIIGSTFTAHYRRVDQAIVPVIMGRAHVTAEASLLLDSQDPFCWGIRPRHVEVPG